MEEDYINNPAKSATPQDKVYDDLQFRKYDAHRKRFAVGGEFDFKPNDDHRYYFRANMFGYDEQIIKNHLIFNNLGGAYATTINGNQVSTQSDITMKGTNSQTIARNNVYVLGGEDDFQVVKLDYHVAYSRATNAADRSFGATVTGPKGVHVTYDNTSDPNFPMMKVTDGTNLNDPSLYTLTKLSNGTEKDADEEYSYAGNATIPVNILSDADRLKFGFSVRLRDKSATPNLSQKVSVPSKTLLSTLSPLPADTNYYHNRYTNGPGINDGLLAANALSGTWAMAPTVVDTSSIWSGDENIYAGYGMYTGEYGAWGFMAGVRLESTVAKYTFVDDQLGKMTMPKSYTNFFPSAQIRYEFASDLIARASYSSGIGRPGFTQVTGNSSVNVTDWIISTGNPTLKPTTGNNLDLDLEWYLNDSGIFEVGAFDKEFQNYIFKRDLVVSTDPRAVALGWVPADGTIHLDSYGNIPTGYARGIEVAYQQKFTFLPKPFDGFGFDGNYTAVTSSSDEYPGEKHALPGTAPSTFNASIFYEAYGLTLRLSSQYTGHNLYAVGGSRAQDQFEDSRFQVDWTSSYQLCDNATVYFNVKNINNAPLRIYMGTPSWPIQREFYDQTYETGVRLKL
jgi:TonB-dependent receptor